ncbi:MAG: response regulator [Silicimonas sp.]|nr:response regulator [Silicimonas sp.]
MQNSPKTRRSFLQGAAIYLAVVLLSATAFWVISTDAREKIDALAVANADSTQWSLAQSEVEFLSLMSAVQAAAVDGSQISNVRKRFDVFYSRVQTIKSSSAFVGVRDIPEVAEAMTKIDAFLESSIPTIDADDVALRQSVPQLLSGLEERRADLRDLSLAGVRVFAQRSEAQRKTVASALTDLGWIAFGLLALLLGVVGVLLANIRASQRQTSEIALTQSRLQAIISTSIDGILVVDKNGDVLDYNGAAEGIFGYTRDEALGEDMSTLIIPDHLRDMHNAGMSRYRETGVKHVVGSGLLALEAKRKDGSVFPVELSINSAEAEEGEIFVSFLRDISQRVANEQELVEARDKALAGEKAKADLLAVMSHEMRTPLNGVLGTLQLLSTTTLDQKQEKYVGVMEMSGKLLLEHVNNVLDISRADAGMIAVAHEKFNLQSLTEEVVDGLIGQATARGNSLNIVRLGSQVQRVMGDEGRVRQILFNLLGNAIKFTENGTVTLEVEASEVSELVEFRVIDSGIGISEDDIARIFEDFVTLDASYQREVEGTGLGLGIVKRLVTMLGGEIGVESDQGSGSVFWFNLPLPRVSARTHSTPIEVGFEGGPHQYAANVLVVEDNEINRMIVGEMLERHGCEVTEAEDGHEGVLFAGNVAFDLILMDISMPRIDGVTAAQKIRADRGPNHETPIIALTAHAMPDDVQKFQDAGMLDVVTKPISAGRLSEVLGMALNKAPKHIPTSTQMDELRTTFGVEEAEELAQKATEQLHEGFAELERLINSQTSHKETTALAHKLAGTAAMFGREVALQELRNIEHASSDLPKEEMLGFVESGKSALKLQ